MTKPRTSRALEANAGTQRQLAVKLAKLSSDFNSDVALDVLRELYKEGLLTSGVKPAAAGKEPGWSFFRRSFRLSTPEQAKDLINTVITSNKNRWTAAAEIKARDTSQWACRLLLRDVSSSQQRAMRTAGLGANKLKNAWTTPISKTLSVSPGAAAAATQAVTANTAQITRIRNSDLERVAREITTVLSGGGTTLDVRNAVLGLRADDADRAETVAAGQTNALTQTIARENAEAVGCVTAIWKHVPGRFTSRDTHEKMDGQPFDLAQGMFDPDPDVMRYVQPGELYNCRCTFRVVIPLEKTPATTGKTAPRKTAARRSFRRGKTA